jgi:hypothetical protein
MLKGAKQLISLFFCFFLLAGCTTTGQQKTYAISLGEANNIAFEEFMKFDRFASFNKRPKIYDDSKVDRKNKKLYDLLYGFDVFGEDGKSKFKESRFFLYQDGGIIFRTGNKVLIVVDKNDGQIKYKHFFCPFGELMSTPEGREMFFSFLKELKGTTKSKIGK